MVAKAIPKVKRGQVWRALDSREGARWLVVESVDRTRAIARVTCRVHKKLKGAIVDTGRHTTVRIDRFRPTSTGYMLVDRVGDEHLRRAP